MSQPDLHENERTIAQLVTDATHDIKGIVTSQVELAKAEVSAGAKVMGKGAGLLAGAAVLAILGLIYLFHTLAHVLDVWLPLWAGYLIVTVLIFIGAAVLGLLGKKSLDNAKASPDRAVKQAELTVAAIKDATGH